MATNHLPDTQARAFKGISQGIVAKSEQALEPGFDSKLSEYYFFDILTSDFKSMSAIASSSALQILIAPQQDAFGVAISDSLL